MKHKYLWTFLMWMLIFCVFELPLQNFSLDMLIKTNNNMAFIVIIDLYAIACVFALGLAKCVINTIEVFVVNKSNKEDEKPDFKETISLEWQTTEKYQAGFKDGVCNVLGIMQRYKDRGYTLEEIIEEVFRQHNDIFQIENLKPKPDEGLFVIGTSGTGKSFNLYDAYLENLLQKIESEGSVLR